MRQIGELFLELPFYNFRRMCLALQDLGNGVGRDRVRRLMRKMGFCAVYQPPGRASRIPGIRSIRICFGDYGSPGRTKSGTRTLCTSR